MFSPVCIFTVEPLFSVIIHIADICVSEKFSVIFYPYINSHLNSPLFLVKERNNSTGIILVVTVKFVSVVNITSDLSTLFYVNNP